MYFGFDEPWLAVLAKERLHPGCVVYDIGAHIGYTALIFSRYVGVNGKVFAFELLPSTAKLLSRSIQLNHKSNISVHTVGLSNENGCVDITAGTTMMASLAWSEKQSGAPMERCSIARLDDYRKMHDLPAPDFIKVDIEGAEYDFLIGAEATIRTTMPILVVEFHSKDLLAKGFHYLSQMKYELHRRGKPKLSSKDLHRLSAFHESVLCLPPTTT